MGRLGPAQRGFSLLEILVAMAIMAMVLGAIYQAAGSSVRLVQAGEQYSYAVTLAESLLAEHSVVPESGSHVSGEFDGRFHWEVSSFPLEDAAELSLAPLHAIEVTVSWRSVLGRRSLTLHSVVAGSAQ